jgi:nicotinate-nucleotide adenylyltransferase
MIGLFGGTFNPIHNGHIQLALELQAKFSLQRVEFVPCFLPVHRDLPQIEPHQREQMVNLAIQAHEVLRLNSLELERGGASYTFDTLSQIKTAQPDLTLCWLMGVDSFNSFETWKNPDGILKLAHLIVCSRPGVAVNAQRWSDHFLSADEVLSDFSAGKIVFHQMPANHCSSTDIRRQLKNHHPVTDCLAQPVLNFILQNHLYES